MCEKINKRGIAEADVHLYDHPQEELRDCPHCESMDESDAGVTNKAFEETQRELDKHIQENVWLKSQLAKRNIFGTPNQTEIESPTFEDETIKTSDTVISLIQCPVEGCKSHGFNSKKTYNQHVKKKHMDTKINNLPFFDKKIPCPECHHEILSSNLHRHLNRDCRRRFLTECEYCGSMMSSHRLMEHQLGRNKKGGCKSKYEGISMEE